MNKADSERISGAYQSRGYRPASSPSQADEVIINTCSVRQAAEDRVVGLVYNLRQLKASPKIIVTGCMLHYDDKTLRQILPSVDEFLPISEVGFSYPAIRVSQTHAWIPISTGCNSFCTYCIVPFSRGLEKSRPQAEIIAEIDQLVKKGYIFITLLGQNVNSYGLERINITNRKRVKPGDKMPRYQDRYHQPIGTPPFVKLLRRIVTKFPELKKISFLTSNPWDFYDELIDLIARYPQFDRYLHLAVQSGDNQILKQMNRWYTAEEYLSLLAKIRSKIPAVEIGTDIIVGFPGETQAQFNNTVKLAQKAKFNVAYIAMYSPRPGTISTLNLPDKIPHSVKKTRFKILNTLINS